jgi:hypothetical protein
MTGWELDHEPADALVADRLDASGQAVLAEQVAWVVPVHWVAPGPVVTALSHLVDKLGGGSNRLPRIPAMEISLTCSANTAILRYRRLR